MKELTLALMSYLAFIYVLVPFLDNLPRNIYYLFWELPTYHEEHGYTFTSTENKPEPPIKNQKS